MYRQHQGNRGAHYVGVLDGAAEEGLSQRVYLLPELALVWHNLDGHTAAPPPAMVDLPK